MKPAPLAQVPVVLILIFLVGCRNAIGSSQYATEQTQAQQADAARFHATFSKHCSGCHGADGHDGPATDLANPLYLAWADDATLRDVIAKGRKETTMPGFAHDLSNEQIGELIQGMRRWSKREIVLPPSAPAYKAQSAGDPERGRQVYGFDCIRCHGPENGPPGKAGAILDGTFLGLVSDQMLRTTAVCGRPDLGMPDFRTRMKGHVLTDQELTDVVAFVAAHRPKMSGTPYSQSLTSTASGEQTLMPAGDKR